MSAAQQSAITALLKLNPSQQLFFSVIDYSDRIYSKTASKLVLELCALPKVLVAGIANPKPFFEFLEDENSDLLTFPDHHHFTQKDVDKINALSKNSIIITTEKDYVRLKHCALHSPLYYLPIKSSFIENAKSFDTTIFKFAENFKV